MSIRNEFENLRPRSRLEDAAAILVCIGVMAGAYFLDKARIAAFGLVPALAIITYSSMRGVSWRATPRLFALTYFISATVYACATLWVIFNPMAG